MTDKTSRLVSLSIEVFSPSPASCLYSAACEREARRRLRTPQIDKCTWCFKKRSVEHTLSRTSNLGKSCCVRCYCCCETPSIGTDTVNAKRSCHCFAIRAYLHGKSTTVDAAAMRLAVLLWPALWSSVVSSPAAGLYFFLRARASY